jgi:hypothetical protein
MIKKLLIQPMLLLSLVFLILSNNKVAAQSPVIVQNASGPNMCNGSAYLIDSSAILSTIYWQGNGAVTTGVMSISNLCPGTYLCYYAYQSSTGLDSNFVSFVIGTGITNPCANYQVSSTVTNTTAALACNGGIAISVTGGSAPYTYYWTNSTVSGGNPTNLCAGSYGVMVMDANGCADSSVAVVGVGIVPTISDSLIITNVNPFPNTPVLGTLTSTLEDCLLNFNAVDSVAMTGITSFSSNPSTIDSVIVTWTVWDTTGTVIATYPVMYVTSNSTLGVYNFMFVLYCSQKSTNVKTIIVNQYMNLSSLAIAENNDLMVSIVNPIANELTIDFKTPQTGVVVVVTDASGKVVAEKEFTSNSSLALDATSWTKGIYFVTLSSGNNLTTRRVIK